MSTSTLDIEPYHYALGEEVTFYLVDPQTGRGGRPQQGTVLLDEGRLTVFVRDEAGMPQAVRPGHLWNRASQEHAVNQVLTEIEQGAEA